jgi:hypothetical protein
MKKTSSPKLLFENVDLNPICPIMWWGLHEDDLRAHRLFEFKYFCDWNCQKEKAQKNVLAAFAGPLIQPQR